MSVRRLEFHFGPAQNCYIRYIKFTPSLNFVYGLFNIMLLGYNQSKK